MPPQLRERIYQFVVDQTKTAGGSTATLEELRQRREEVAERTNWLVAHLDQETLADAQPEIERLKAERRAIDEQLAAAEAAQQAQARNPDDITARVLDALSRMAAEMNSMPKFTLRQLLATTDRLIDNYHQATLDGDAKGQAGYDCVMQYAHFQKGMRKPSAGEFADAIRQFPRSRFQAVMARMKAQREKMRLPTLELRVVSTRGRSCLASWAAGSSLSISGATR